jgi:hypothetical protein
VPDDVNIAAADAKPTAPVVINQPVSRSSRRGRELAILGYGRGRMAVRRERS